MTSITSNSTHGHVRWFTPVDYHGHTVMVEEDPHDLDSLYCREHGHRLVPLDHYDVPTGELYCANCYALVNDPTYVHDQERMRYLAWKRWGWRCVYNITRRERLFYWLRDVVRLIGRMVGQ